MNPHEIPVGSENEAWLTDHAVQELAVIPGAFYLAVAAARHPGPILLGRSEFPQPFVLGKHNAVLRVQQSTGEQGQFRYSFSEPGSGEPCAIVDLEGRTTHAFPATEPDRLTEEVPELPGPDYYAQLERNGNRYGPSFRNLASIRITGDLAIARLAFPADSQADNKLRRLTAAIDAGFQALASFRLSSGRTFILRSIDRLELRKTEPGTSGWIRAQLIGETGSIEVAGEDGIVWLVMRGVRFTHAEPHARELVVAATFSAEPIADVFGFWGNRLGLPLRARFAPYSQVFQELLDPGSSFHRNASGDNVLLLNLADWLNQPQDGGPDGQADSTSYVLPNGMRIAHLNRHETDYVYHEIFEDRCYLRHGIALPPRATVIDIGGNVGLFALFVRQTCPKATVYSFEPNPAAFQALKTNCDNHGDGRLRPFQAGVADRCGSARLTSYANSSVFSSFHPNRDEDRHAIETVAANVIQRSIGSTTVGDYLEDLMVGRLEETSVDCRLTTVSAIIAENHLDRVDLLKIDAEKCELEILGGISESDWRRVRQIVIEVHDRTKKSVEKVQAILSAHGFLHFTEEETLLAGSGLFNVYGRRPDAAGASADGAPAASDPAVERIERTADDFAVALRNYAKTATGTTIVCFCPHRPLSNEIDAAFASAEARIIASLGTLPRVETIPSQSIREGYPSRSFHDPHSNELGHIPYSPEGFAAIGTCIVRSLTASRRSPYKAIALDCDNTLWQGVCGEDGPDGVTVTPAHRLFQEFILARKNAGMLVCLCSRNAEADVRAVFDRNPGMVLKWRDLAAHRVNWRSKSQNLDELAAALNIGIDSFIFADDNPVECAEVRAHAPGAYTLDLPSAPTETDIRQVLAGCWAFDRPRTTAEDSRRTQLVQEDAVRQQSRDAAPTLRSFLEGLQLEVAIREPRRDEIERVAQLTLRTNQFNPTTVRRTAGEMDRLLGNTHVRCLALSARDRFGDYGLVGAVIYQAESDRYRIETLVLSCRALGRGIEHQFLADLGRRAREESLPFVQITFRRTEKNQPAWEFLQSIESEEQKATADGMIFVFSADTLAGLKYEPDDRRAGEHRHAASGGPTSSGRLIEAAPTLATAEGIARAVEAYRLRDAGVLDVPTAGTVEGRLLKIWRRVLANARVGPSDNFFDAGGTSLNAVQVVAAIRAEFGRALPLVALFENPNVKALAGAMEGRNASAADEALARGSRRKARGKARNPKTARSPQPPR